MMVAGWINVCARNFDLTKIVSAFIITIFFQNCVFF